MNDSYWIRVNLKKNMNNDNSLQDIIKDCKNAFGQLKDTVFPNMTKVKTILTSEGKEVIGGRKNFISTNKFFTTANTLAVSEERKKALIDGPPNIMVVAIQEPLAQFLELNRRGLDSRYYSNTVFMSYFFNYIECNGLKQGKNVVFKSGSDLHNLLSSLDKYTYEGLFKPQQKIDKSGVKMISPVLTDLGDGTFSMNFDKVLTLFSLFTKKVRANDPTQSLKQVTVDVSELHPDVFNRLNAERLVLTNEISVARKKYTDAIKNHQKYTQPLETTTNIIADRQSIINDKIQTYSDQINQYRADYVNLLNKYGFKHTM